MNLPIPVVGQDPGPDWATNIASSLNIVDSHNHTSGQGVQLTPDSLNINTDLPFNGSNATIVRSVRFDPQGSPIAEASDLGCLYEAGVDLYYNDGAGNQVRITQGGSVTGSSGTITGLPSGTASASFAGGTFTWESATNTPAAMAVGPLIIGEATASPNTVTLQSPTSLAANYALTLPAGLPASTSLLIVDNAGNMGSTTTPTLTGGTLSGTFSGSPTFSGAVALSGGGSLAGTFSGTPTFSGLVTMTGGATISETATITGSHATGNGTTLNIFNSSTSQNMIIRGGSGNGSPTINVVSNDDLVVMTNNAEHMRVKSTTSGEIQVTGAAATGVGCVMKLTNTSTSSVLYMQSGSGNDSPRIGASSNDDCLLLANNAEVARMKSGGDFYIANMLQVDGGGVFGVKIFTGSITSSGTATLTAPSGIVLGAYGYSSVNAAVNVFVPILGAASYTPGTNAAIVFPDTFATGAATSEVKLVNQDTNSTNTYRVVMFYQ